SLGRELTDAEITSILRNWTGGDLGSMALCTGVLLTYLADHRDLQLRVRSGVSDTELDAIIDEVLRIDSPFTANRRITTQHTVIGGRPIGPGERVFLNWTAANRDPDAFGDPDEFDPDGNAAHNLVYGIGRHVCPGRELATMELRALLRAVLAVAEAILPDTARTRLAGRPPVGGYETAPLLLRLRRRAAGPRRRLGAAESHLAVAERAELHHLLTLVRVGPGLGLGAGGEGARGEPPAGQQHPDLDLLARVVRDRCRHLATSFSCGTSRIPLRSRGRHP